MKQLQTCEWDIIYSIFTCVVKITKQFSTHSGTWNSINGNFFPLRVVWNKFSIFNSVLFFFTWIFYSAYLSIHERRRRIHIKGHSIRNKNFWKRKMKDDCVFYGWELMIHRRFILIVLLAMQKTNYQSIENGFHSNEQEPK